MDFGAVRLSRVSSVRRVCLAFIAAIALGANHADALDQLQEQKVTLSN